MPLSCNRTKTSCNIISAISLTSFLVNCLNTIISSSLFKNSGLKYCLSSSLTSDLILLYWLSSTESPENSNPSPPPPFSITFEPILEVIINNVFLKSTVLPLESVNLPSSSSCNNKLKTSGCAFSTSSNKTTV